MRAAFSLALLSVLLAACGPTTVVLRQPATGQVAECSTPALIVSPLYDTDGCTKSYAAAGYQQQTP